MLHISSSEAKPGLSLPSWVPHHYVKQVEPPILRYEPETTRICIPATTISSGNTIDYPIDEYEDRGGKGTLGTLMFADNKPYGLTARHVTDDDTIPYQIKQRYGHVQAEARVMAHPMPVIQDQFLSDIAILNFGSAQQIDHSTSRINLYHLSSPRTAASRSFTGPEDRFDDIQRKLEIECSVRVFKDGLETGLTMGLLKRLVHIDISQVSQNSDATTTNRILPHYWIGFVDWITPDIPFTLGGDSGSLVHAHIHSVMVPLGIHLGSIKVGDSRQSVFLSLETFVKVAKMMGLELSF
jgi:hypothetical protein